MDAEKEIREEEAELARKAETLKRELKQSASIHKRAFQLARAGKGAEMREHVINNSVNVLLPENLSLKGDRLQTEVDPRKINFQTLLHAAAAVCEPDTVEFLLDRGECFFGNPKDTQKYIDQKYRCASQCARCKSFYSIPCRHHARRRELS